MEAWQSEAISSTETVPTTLFKRQETARPPSARAATPLPQRNGTAHSQGSRDARCNGRMTQAQSLPWNGSWHLLHTAWGPDVSALHLRTGIPESADPITGLVQRGATGLEQLQVLDIHPGATLDGTTPAASSLGSHCFQGLWAISAQNCTLAIKEQETEDKRGMQASSRARTGRS